MPFVELIGEAYNPVIPLDGAIASWRQAWYEAHSVSVAEVRPRVENKYDSKPPKMPVPERAARLQEQQLRIVSGVKLSGALEPSYALIDLVYQMREDDIVHYMEPSVRTCWE